jgi:hypothetical protein
MNKTNDRVAAAVAEAVKTTKPKKEMKPCQCFSQISCQFKNADGSVEYDIYESCGGETFRDFLPGHDAKLKSVLIKHHLNNHDFHYLDNNGTLVTVNPRQFAATRGWEKFLDAAADKQGRKIAAAQAKAVKKSETKSKKSSEPTPTRGAHPVRFKIGRWEYDGNIEAEDVNELTVSYKNKKGVLVTSAIRRTQLVN